MLRTIMLKAAGIAKNAWAHTRTTLAMASRLPKSVAVTVNSVLATNTGYTTLTRISRAVLSTAWNGLTRLIRGVGRVLRSAVGVVPLAVGFASPAGADLTLGVTQVITETVTGLFERLDGLVRGAGELAWGLAHTTLVRTTVTTASVASGVFVVHSLSQGLLAVKIVQAAPSLMTAVIWITNPWRTLALVAGVALIAMGVALARLVHGSRQQEPLVDEGPEFYPEPPAAAAQVPFTVVPDPEPILVEPHIDWAAVVSSVPVEFTNDGSVIVVGIPNAVPRNYGEIIARIATEAALKHWNRTRVSRPCPSRDDRRLFTKAAKEAVRDYARKQASKQPDSPHWPRRPAHQRRRRGHQCLFVVSAKPESRASGKEGLVESTRRRTNIGASRGLAGGSTRRHCPLHALNRCLCMG